MIHKMKTKNIVNYIFVAQIKFFFSLLGLRPKPQERYAILSSFQLHKLSFD